MFFFWILFLCPHSFVDPVFGWRGNFDAGVIEVDPLDALSGNAIKHGLELLEVSSLILVQSCDDER
jgi:hypothetical protein